MIYRYIFSLFVLIGSIVFARAEYLKITPSDENAKPQEVNIYFSAGVNNKSVSELGAALSNVAINYPSAKKINMIVNSPGGAVEAGKLGYMLVKSTRIPVRAINVGMTASAASVIFCGANERAAFPGAYFLLHPASVTEVSVELKPDILQRLTRDINDANEFGRLVYKQCTNMSDDEITQMNKAEYFSKYIGVSEALDIKLVNGVQESIPEAGVNYFIHDKDDD